jgi:hypothetical protein
LAARAGRLRSHRAGRLLLDSVVYVEQNVWRLRALDGPGRRLGAERRPGDHLVLRPQLKRRGLIGEAIKEQ